MGIKIPRNYNRLTKIVNEANNAMLRSLPNDMPDDEFHYVMARLLMSMSHTICKALPLPKEENEDD